MQQSDSSSFEELSVAGNTHTHTHGVPFNISYQLSPGKFLAVVGWNICRSDRVDRF